MFKKLCWITLLLWSLVSEGQEGLKQSFDSIKQLDLEIIKKIELTNSLLENNTNTTFTEELGYVYHKLGLLHRSNNDFEKAIESTLIAINIRESIASSNKTGLNNSLYNTFIYYRRLDQRREGKQYLDRIIKNNAPDRFNYKALIELAFLSSSEGDYYQALEYLEPVTLSLSTYNDLSIYVKGHLACIYVYSKMAYHEKNLESILLHKQKIEEITSNPLDLADLYLNLSTIFFHDKKASLSYLEKAIPVYSKLNDSIKLGVFYNNIGVLYSELNQTKKSTLFYTKALQISNSWKMTADVYLNQGYYLPSALPDEKISYYYRALNTVLYGQEVPKRKNPNYLLDIKNSPNKTDVLHYLSEIGAELISAYELDPSTKHLIKAKKIFHLIDQVISLIRLDSSQEKSKLFWIDKGVDTYLLAVKVCYLLNDIDGAFYFMEKNKSLLLLENLDKLKMKVSSSIPKSVLEREKFFEFEKISLRSQLEETPDNQVLQRAFTEINNEHSIFLDSLKITFPKYYNIKREPKISSLKQAIEKHVSPTSNLVEYILTPNDGYGLFCSNDEMILFQIEEAPLFLKRVNELKEMISKPYVKESEFVAYQLLANVVYDQIFPFPDALSKLDSKKLVVIPDYEIQNLPFSALVATKRGTHYQPDYLLYHTEVSYLHSVSVFDRMGTPNNKKQSMIGFAPVNFEKHKLPNLLASGQEMDNYASILPMELKIQKAATKEAFQKSIKEHSIIHLSTHAGYETSKTPWISFYDEKLTLDDFYQMETAAHLIILDACKSALGNLEIGEGVNSLSRALFYNGTESVIASQWNANGQANYEIFHEFYSHIKANQRKSKSLQSAKIDYLSTNQLDRLSPYYWAPLTVTGNTDALSLQHDRFSNWLFIALGIMALIMLFILIRKKTLS